MELIVVAIVFGFITYGWGYTNGKKRARDNIRRYFE